MTPRPALFPETGARQALEGMNQKLEPQQKANIPFRLAPKDWKSGEIPWLLAVLAHREVEQALERKLDDSVFKDKTYKRFALTAEPRKPRADSSQDQPTHS